MKHFFLFIFSFFFFAAANGQVHDHDHGHDHSHDHDHHHHEEEKIHDHKNELAGGTAPVYFFNEEQSTIGLHFHYLRKWKNHKIGTGIIYERIFKENRINTIALVGSYNLSNEWQLSIAPGLSFEEEQKDLNFSMLFETSYEFSILDFHLGPFLIFALGNEVTRASIGLHLGYGF